MTVSLCLKHPGSYKLVLSPTTTRCWQLVLSRCASPHQPATLGPGARRTSPPPPPPPLRRPVFNHPRHNALVNVTINFNGVGQGHDQLVEKDGKMVRPRQLPPGLGPAPGRDSAMSADVAAGLEKAASAARAAQPVRSEHAGCLGRVSAEVDARPEARLPYIFPAIHPTLRFTSSA
jgi:hypothetical protein